MASLSGFLDTVVLLGIIQGFILSVLLFRSRRQQPAHRILAVLIGLITMTCLNIYLLDAAWLNSHIVLSILADTLPLVVVMPLGPLIWLYVQATTSQSFQVTRKHYIHFVPVVLDLFPYFLLLVADLGSLTGIMSKGQRDWVSNFSNQYNVYADIPRWASLTIYLWLSHRYIRGQRSKQVTMPEQTTRWLQQFLYVFLAFQAIWLAYLVPYIIPATRQALLNAVDWYPVFVPLVVLIYWLGLKGYLEHSRPAIASNNKLVTPAPSWLPEETAGQLIERLQQVMKAEQLYLNPLLNVNLLAQQAGISAKSVSAVLNQYLDKSFSTFVNEYRVEAFKKRVLEPGALNLTIPAIAMECGFSSAATFQRIFKQLTGTTPSGFMQEARSQV